MTTEFSNIFINALYVCESAALLRASAIEKIGFVWILTFTMCRVVPLPWVMSTWYSLLAQLGCGYNEAERVVGLICTPMPWLINSYFVYMVIEGIRTQSYKKKEMQGEGKEH